MIFSFAMISNKGVWLHYTLGDGNQAKGEPGCPPGFYTFFAVHGGVSAQRASPVRTGAEYKYTVYCV